MRYFIYCRKSSEAEDRQVMSIASQLSTLQRTFVERPEIHIVAVYEESFSAKAPGRQRFDEMIARIEKGEADGIIAWAPDRLARNSVDGGRIIYLLDRGMLRDLKFSTYTFENNSQGKFMLQIMFGQSKYYSDALSENVKRGNRTKVELGWRPNKAPLGYLNDPASRTIVKDPALSPLIRRIFDLMLSDAYSVREICQMAGDDLGLRTRIGKRSGGKPLTLSGTYQLLQNPFYAGILIWNGKTHRGAHEPLVTIDELDRVRALLRKRDKRQAKKFEFAFTGMIRCGECGLLITAEHKTNRYGSEYTYYRCPKRRSDHRCRQPCVRREKLEGQIVDFLRTISMPQAISDWILKCLGHTEEQQRATEEARRLSIERELAVAKTAAGNLTSLRIRELINDEQFIVERQKLDKDQLRLEQALLRPTGPTMLELSQTLISFSNEAVYSFLAGNEKVKRKILNIVGSNFVLTDKKLIFRATDPFNVFAKNTSCPDLLAFEKSIRTLATARDPELLRTIEAIKALDATAAGQRPSQRYPLAA